MIFDTIIPIEAVLKEREGELERLACLNCTLPRVPYFISSWEEK